jgi:hypothetical protein
MFEPGYIHLNNLRDYRRPETCEWRNSDSEMKRVSAELDLEFSKFSKGALDSNGVTRGME